MAKLREEKARQKLFEELGMKPEEDPRKADCYVQKDTKIPSESGVSNNTNQIPNIVLLGETGVGKSFFLNGLFGSVDPNIGLFHVGTKPASCTRNTTSITGRFLGRKLTGLDMMVNLIDTPGKI